MGRNANCLETIAIFRGSQPRPGDLQSVLIVIRAGKRVVYDQVSHEDPLWKKYIYADANSRSTVVSIKGQ